MAKINKKTTDTNSKPLASAMTKRIRVYTDEQKLRIKQRNAKRYVEKKEQLLKQTNAYYHANKDLYKANRIKNKEKLAIYHSKYMKDKRESDSTFRLTNSLRFRIYRLLKHSYETSSSLELVGCSIEELQTHLKKQFQEGMSFENYGEWHIDHIKPCASFDLSKEDEQRECFNYTNLQPLWAVDNLIKGARW